MQGNVDLVCTKINTYRYKVFKSSNKKPYILKRNKDW